MESPPRRQMDNQSDLQKDEALARCLQAEELAQERVAQVLPQYSGDSISPQCALEVRPDAAVDNVDAEPVLTDEELARMLQQQEDETEVSNSLSHVPDVDQNALALTDEELARMLQEEEEEGGLEEVAIPSPPTPPPPRNLSNSMFSLQSLNKLPISKFSGAAFGCCGGLQLAALLGCGHVVTWCCALGCAVFGHVTNNSRPAHAPQDAHDDDDWYPVSDDEDMSRGLDAATIEGHTIGHAYTAPVSVTPPTSGTSRRGDNGDDPNKCMVCMEVFATGDLLRTLPCVHRYHQHCIDEWLCRSPECPICKRDITSVSLLPSIPQNAARPSDRTFSIRTQFARARRLWSTQAHNRNVRRPT